MPLYPFSSSVMDDNSTHILGLSPLSVTIIGIISAATVLLTYHCLIRWCNRREFVPHRSHPRLFGTNLEDTPSSIENSIVELIPSYKYSKDIGMVSKTQDGTCAVCLCEFVEGEPVRVLPDCLHPFHVPCIDMWLLSHSNCPICRTDTTRLPLRHQLEPDAGALRSGEQLL